VQRPALPQVLAQCCALTGCLRTASAVVWYGRKASNGLKCDVDEELAAAAAALGELGLVQNKLAMREVELHVGRSPMCSWMHSSGRRCSPEQQVPTQWCGHNGSCQSLCRIHQPSVMSSAIRFCRRNRRAAVYLGSGKPCGRECRCGSCLHRSSLCAAAVANIGHANGWRTQVLQRQLHYLPSYEPVQRVVAAACTSVALGSSQCTFSCCWRNSRVLCASSCSAFLIVQQKERV
jgi:hypothetical protein